MGMSRRPAEHELLNKSAEWSNGYAEQGADVC